MYSEWELIPTVRKGSIPHNDAISETGASVTATAILSASAYFKRNTLPWIGRVGLLKSFVNVVIKCIWLKRCFKSRIQ